MLAATANPTPPRLPDHRVALVAALVLAAVVGTAPRARAETRDAGRVMLRVDACTDRAASDCWFVGESKRVWTSARACQERTAQIIGDMRFVRVLLKGQPAARRWALVRCRPLHDLPEA